LREKGVKIPPTPEEIKAMVIAKSQKKMEDY